MGANLLIGVTIPFSIKVPFSAHPSCSVEYPSINNSDDYGYIQHFLIVEVPCLSVKRIMSIIIKNNIKFTYQNKLLKIPCDFPATKSKSSFLLKKGNFTIKIQLPKNVFFYDEPIPYLITLDLKDLNLPVTKLQLSSLERYKKIHCKI